MNTTAVVIEHLVIGIQTALWITLFVFTFFGYEWLPILALPSQVFVVMISLLFVYPLGAFMDEVSDALFRKRNRKIRDQQVHDSRQTAFALLATLRDSSSSQYFHYLRTRIRLARSSVLNFPLLTIAAATFTCAQFSSQLGRTTIVVVLTELLVGIFLMCLALFSWRRASDTFARKIKEGYDALEFLTDSGRKGNARKKTKPR